MLGQPLSMLLPPVVGLRISGEPKPGITATDVVLTVTELLRDHGVVGAFVECYGPGVAALPLETRATIGNMSPEYGATCTMFPIDQVTVDYLRFTGRDEEHLALVEAYAKAQGLWHDPGAPEPVYSEYATLDLGDVEPSLAGPSRPQDRVAARCGRRRLPGGARPHARARARRAGRGTAPPDGRRRRGHCGHHQLHQHLEPPGHGRGRPPGPEGGRARAALQALGEDVARPRLPRRHATTSSVPASSEPLEQLGFYLVGYGCTTCIGNSGPLLDGVSDAVKEGDLSVAAVLSGNRNFEGRIHPDVRMNYLASPPLVVAYALAGHHGPRPDDRADRARRRGQPGHPLRAVAVHGRGERDHPGVAHVRHVPHPLRRGLRRRRVLAAGPGGGRARPTPGRTTRPT